MEWHFRRYQIGEITRDPINGEFFSTEAIENPAQALVREGIQNSLDASQGRPVEVRIFLSGESHALSATSASRWFEGAWTHFQSSSNGLHEPPTIMHACPFLLFEDFGTTGLQGDELQALDEGVDNPFFYFFRAEGRSNKAEKDLGRWGVGKQVFPRSSRINAFFGLTVRADDGRRLLMGHNVLKSRRIDDVHFSPDGHFGRQCNNGLIIPISDTNVLEQFCKDFQITRKTDEPGLSIVVPYVDPEISIEYLQEAIITDYFYPILTGMLTVVLMTPNRRLAINPDNLAESTYGLDEKKARIAQSTIDLARWAILHEEQDILKLNPCPPERPVWTDNLIPDELIQPMQVALSKGEKLAVRASLTVREKGKQPQPSYFDLFLWQDGNDGGRPVFTRKGIVVSDIHAPLSRGIRSLVIITDKPLVTLLGDSENPAHTQWQKDSDNFKTKYIYGPSYIEFVTRAVSRLVNSLSVQEGQEDENLLLDIFSLPPDRPADEPKRPDKTTQPRQGDQSGSNLEAQERRKKRFRVTKVPGGFTVCHGDNGTTPPVWLEIKCAYDIRRGNPLTKYEAALKAKAPDFRIGESGVRVTKKTGVTVAKQENNYLRIKIVNPEFHVLVDGFDQNRDLFVRVKMTEGDDD